MEFLNVAKEPKLTILGGKLELGRYRFFKSVSVFVFLVGFFKSRYRIRYRFFKISRYRFQFSVFPHEPTIAPAIRQPYDRHMAR